LPIVDIGPVKGYEIEPSRQSAPPPHDGQPDFSIMRGGPLYRLYLATRLGREPLALLGRRLVVISLIAWLPLLILSAITGTLRGGPVRVPFLYDIEVHLKYLLSIPLLIAAEVPVDRSLLPVMRLFVERGFISPEDRPRYERLFSSAKLLCHSGRVELLIIVAVYAIGHSFWIREIELSGATWYALPAPGRSSAHPGWVLVCLRQHPAPSVLVPEMVFSSFCMGPPPVAGLSTGPAPHAESSGPERRPRISRRQCYGVRALSPCGRCHAGRLDCRRGLQGLQLARFEWAVAGVIVLLPLIVLSPLAFFAGTLFRTKNEGLDRYGSLASRYAAQFDHKWIRGEAPETESLLGNADIRSLAGLMTIIRGIDEMQLIPCGKDTVIHLVVITALPLFPLAMTIFPWREVLVKFLEMLI
jgi:hypothetical protein